MAERITGGVSAGSGPLRIALEAMCKLAQSNDVQVRRWMVPAFPILQESAAHELWDEAIVHQLSTAVVRQARDAGALAVLPPSARLPGRVHSVGWRIRHGGNTYRRGDSITAATDHLAPVRYHSLMLSAWRGIPADAAA